MIGSVTVVRSQKISNWVHKFSQNGKHTLNYSHIYPNKQLCYNPINIMVIQAVDLLGEIR